MRTFVSCLLLGIAGFQTYLAGAQDLMKTKLSADSARDGVAAIYTNVNRYDGGEELILYKNGKYKYLIRTTGWDGINNGKWTLKQQQLLLSSDIVDSAVAIRIANPDSPVAAGSTSFLIPVNANGDRLPDARIFINDENNYCFPFFDTCVGSISSIKRIKVSFGDGFSSRWTDVHLKGNKNILVIAEVSVLFSSYEKFNARKYRIIGSGLWLVE